MKKETRQKATKAIVYVVVIMMVIGLFAGIITRS